jgi:hypothetical protein
MNNFGKILVKKITWGSVTGEDGILSSSRLSQIFYANRFKLALKEVMRKKA